MTDDNIKSLLRSAFPPPNGDRPTRNLWPSIVERIQAPNEWSPVDICVAAGVLTGLTIALMILPKALLLLAYHL